jgi:hypothetical protein
LSGFRNRNGVGGGKLLDDQHRTGNAKVGLYSVSM